MLDTRTRRLLIFCLPLLGGVLWGVARAEEVATDAPPAVDFAREVQPLLAQHCFRCHGPDEAKGGLRLNKRETALAETDSGERAIVPGKPAESALLARIASTDDDTRMPPEGKPLSAEQVAVLRRWIEGGAKWQNHWAFEPVANVAPPRVRDTAWISNPADAFVKAKLEAKGLTPAPAASRMALVRRIYFDLTGLPPTPDEVEQFLADQATDAYERLVDRLLDSPQYGERWARHWLDLVRYADTNSFERDGVKPNAWRYRDYVIRSLNEDKPYDQFVREQLAGDELSHVTPETLTATGYYRLGLWDDEPADLLQARFDELDDIVGTTGQVFLGLTVNCARCHDHKLDPIPQADYYRLVSFFHEIDRFHMQNSQIDVSSPELVAQHRKLEDNKSSLRKRMKPLEKEGIVKMSAEDQRKTEGPERAKVLEEKLQSNLTDEQWQEYSRCRAALKELEAVKLPPRETVLSVGKIIKKTPQTFILARGNPHAPGDEVVPEFLSALGGGRAAAVPGEKSSGRRKALADWIASPNNPLTARVMVNRVWQHHFGRGLVRSSSNFGSLGTPPTHPELLDWLAQQFVASGWRLKPLHRLIVTSNAYRMASSANPDAEAVDPENDLLWRFDMRRLEAEEIRDAMLAVSGQLNLKMFGPGIFPHLSREVLETQSIPGNGWSESPLDEQYRRSIYIHVKRSLTVPLLAEFDICDTDGSCAVRFSTTQPTQALGMLNGDFAHARAAALAARIAREAGTDDEAQVRRALRLALSRAPDEKGVERGLKLIQSLQSEHGVTRDKAVEYFCLMVLNLNEFSYLE